MASLLSFLGGAAKRVGNTINNDVVQPINRDIVQPVNRDVVQPVAHYAPAVINNTVNPVAPVPTAIRNYALQNLAGLARSAGQIGMIGPNDIKALTGIVTHNPVAAQNAFNQAGQGVKQVRQFAQFAPRAAVQLAASIPGTGQGPKSGQSFYSNNPIATNLTGGGEIPSLQRVYKTTPGGTLNKVVNTAGTGAIDLAAVAGGVKGTKAEAGVKNVVKGVQNLDQAGKVKLPSATDTKATGKVPPVETPTAPLIRQASTEGKIAKVTSLENRLNRLGGTAQDTLQVIRNKEVGQAMHTQNLKTAAQPFFDLPADKQALAIKVQKGEATTTDAGIQAGASSLRSMFKQAHSMATGAGKDIGNLGKNYFPRSYPKGWFDKPKNFNNAVQELVSSGKAPTLEAAINRVNQIKVEHSINPTEFGNFLAREKDLPGGIENANTVSNYIKGASKSISEAEHFGPDHQALNSLVAKAVQNGEDAGAIRNIISDYLHPARSKPGAVTSSLNTYQKALRVIQLPRAAVSHLPQGLANTGADIGYAKYFKAVGQKIFGGAEHDRLMEKGGFRVDNFGKASGISDKATAPGLGPMLQFHREVAAEGGMSMAQGLAKKGDVAGLRAMGVDGKLATDSSGKIQLTDLQKIKAGHFEANKSIGSHSVLQSPAWIQTNGGKLVGQYRKMYTFKQAERISNYMRQAKNGNVAPLARYLAIGVPVTGAAVALAKDEIKNPGSNPLSDKKKLALDSFGNSGVGSLGYGAVESAFNAATHNYGNDSRWSNAAGAIAPGLGFAVQTGQNADKAFRGKPNALKREGLSMVPVGGTALANKFAPPQLGTSGNQTLDKAINDLKTTNAAAKGQPGGKWEDYLPKEDATIAKLTAVQQQDLVNQGTITQADVTRANKLQATAKQQLGAPKKIDTAGLTGADTSFLQRYDRLSTDGKAKFNSDAGNQYQMGQIKYNQNSANGKLSRAQDINAKENLAKLQVNAMKDTSGNYLFSSDVTTAYGLSKGEIADMLGSPGGQALADKVVAYGDALVKAGAIAKNKWRDSKGNISMSSKTSGSSGSRTKVPKTITTGFKTAAAMKAPKQPKINVRVAKAAFKAPKTRKLAVSKIPSNYTSRKLG